MKVVSLIVALVLALAPGAPARSVPIADAAGAAVLMAAQRAAATDDADTPAPPGPLTYLLLALGLFGMGLVSRRRRSD